MFPYFLLPVSHILWVKAIVINFISNFVSYVLFIIVIQLTADNRGKKLIPKEREQRRRFIHSSNVLK